MLSFAAGPSGAERMKRYTKPQNHTEMGTIIYLAGLVLAILAVIDICKKPITLVGKIICCVAVLATSWIGLLVYYLYAKNHITEWFK